MPARRVSLSLAFLLAAGLLLAAPAPAGATFSGGNGKVVFVSDRDGDNEIYAADYTGGLATQLTFNTASDTEPNVSADGSQVAFISDRDGKAEIYTMRMDGSSEFRVTNNSITESHPIWAPNATLIGFAGTNGTDSEIYTVKPVGTNLINLTNDPVAFDANPAWSPGGLTIAFDSTNRAGNTGTDVYTMGKDGSAVKRLTTTGSDSHPNWAPDNRNLVFQSGRDVIQPGPTHFSSVNKPVGLAFSADALLVTQLTADKVLSINDAGISSTFANLPPTGGANLERYIAVSPGMGGFLPGYVYVTVRTDILQITPDGSTVTTFATIPALPASNNTIAFDTVGTFGNDMLIASGKKAVLYRVKSDGTWSVVRDMHLFAQELEAPQVAPLDYIPYPGQAIVSDKLDSKIYAIDTDGSFSEVGPWDSADEVDFVPATPCNYGISGGAYFLAMRDQSEILKFPASDFQGVTGALIDGETTTDIGLFQSNGTSIDISLFHGPIGTPELEGTDFAPCGTDGPGGSSAAPSSGSASAGAPAAACPLCAHEIYKMTSAGLNETRLTVNSFDDAVPVWSPNGQTIVFQTDRDDPGAPGCEDSGSCVFELYSMNAVDGSGQTNSTNNLAADDIQADWMATGGIVTVADFSFTPSTVRPKQGTSVLWNFNGSTHTATDTTGMALYDSGNKEPGEYFFYKFPGAGSYAYFCSIHPTMTGTVKVPILASPLTGGQTTTFTITWATSVPAGFRYDVQIRRPSSSVFVDWKINQLVKAGTFVPDDGAGVYSFQARLEKISDGTVSGYSTPVSITVT